MTQNRAAIFTMLFLVATSGWVVAKDNIEKAAEQKTFRVEQRTVDLGVVQAGSDGVAVFVFRNDTDNDVQIIRAKPT